ncbi:MAG: hypothetical protein ACOCRK_01940 [bacterium]
MFNEENISCLTNREYNSLLGLYGYNFMAEYINKSKPDNTLKERILGLERNLKKLDQCRKFIAFQKMLLIEDNNIRTKYIACHDKLYNDLIEFFSKVNKIKIINIIGEDKFIDIFLSAILIDLQNTRDEELPEYLTCLSKNTLKLVIDEFVYSNFIGNPSVKTKIYKLYKKLYENDYKERIETSESIPIDLSTGLLNDKHNQQEMIVIGVDDVENLMGYVDNKKFSNLINEVIPNTKYFIHTSDRDTIYGRCIERLIKNFIYIPDKNDYIEEEYDNIFFEKYELMTIPLYIVPHKNESYIVYHNIYQQLMDKKYSA